MLSSTADHLFWMARSIERAENTARMLDITYKMSLLKQATLEPFQEWSAMLSISGLHFEFTQRHKEIGAAEVIHFMALDEANPASIYSSLKVARDNARAVRGSITSEMWESLNATWLEIRKVAASGIPSDGVSAFFEWVKERSHLFRGITYGTMLRDEGFRFIRLGTFLERADNTMRILDVKYHILLPSLEDVGGAVGEGAVDTAEFTHIEGTQRFKCPDGTEYTVDYKNNGRSARVTKDDKQYWFDLGANGQFSGKDGMYWSDGKEMSSLTLSGQPALQNCKLR